MELSKANTERSEVALPKFLVECDACQKRYHFRGWTLDELTAYHYEYHWTLSGVE